jgi:hypothetical protein
LRSLIEHFDSQAKKIRMPDREDKSKRANHCMVYNSSGILGTN